MNRPAVLESDLLGALAKSGVSDVENSTLTRALYSSDASLYRVTPQVVVHPKNEDDVRATLAVANELAVPITARGAGTSIAGNAVGTGIILNFLRHMNQIIDIDPVAKIARVQPGVIQADLQKAAHPHGLRFGPDPSTSSRCTIGGMIGNNACGPRALGYGRTADNVVDLKALAINSDSWPIERMRTLVNGNLALIRTEFGRFSRQVSGYGFEHLLPENNFNVPKFLVGSEATLAIATEATVNLVPNAQHRVLVLLGYPSMADAGDDVVTFLQLKPTAVEGLDARIVDVYRNSRSGVPELPAGKGWLFIEFVGDEPAELAAKAKRTVEIANTAHTRVVVDQNEQATLWRIREEGAGLAARSFEKPAKSGWEDAAVPPENLGSYLRAFDQLMDEFDLQGAPYGHFGEGCVHVRIDFDPATHKFREFIEAAADLVAAHGGSMSGEHGDGRARSELLPKMYSPAALDLFAHVKKLWDRDNLLNPGVLVDPAPFDANLRGVNLPDLNRSGGMLLPEDHGDFSLAVHRCTGVGKCVASNSAEVMCPSYQATKNEKDSTRGRARVLQEMVDGRLVQKKWNSTEVDEALDLCLSCKGCASDCPTGVDMATYKSEYLYQKYKNRLRPRQHYFLGRLPALARFVGPFSSLANVFLRTPVLRSVIRAIIGIDQRRSLPQFAAKRFSKIARTSKTKTGKRLALWADSFTEYFTTGGGLATIAVLEAAGYEVEFIDQRACCALTMISTGQLDQARSELANTVSVLSPYVEAGVPIVGVEPSCLATLRSDLTQLLDDPNAIAVSKGVFTLAEILSQTPNWQPPDLGGVELIVQPHCHHHSVLGFNADAEILARTGATVTQLSGCCGLAGNFGVEQGHYEVSVAVAEQQLLPAISGNSAAVLVADGFSCRTQIADLADRPAFHLAEILAGVNQDHP